MSKVILLSKMKGRILYRSVKTLIAGGIVLLMIGMLFAAALSQREDKIRVFLHNQDASDLARIFMEMASDRIAIEEREQKEGIDGVKSYQAELLLVIPEGAAGKLLAGETEDIFEIYYLKENSLAALLADRMISGAFPEIYRLRGEYFAGSLYEAHALERKKDLLNAFRHKVWVAQQTVKKGFYFSILSQFSQEIEGSEQESRPQHGDLSSSLDKEVSDEEADVVQEKAAIEAEREDQGALSRVTAGVLLVVTSGLNYLFLLYFGLKLLYLRDKNDKIKAAGLQEGHQLTSDLTVLLLPEIILMTALYPAALALEGLLLWQGFAIAGLLAVGINLILIRLVREKQMYFPIGVGIYIAAVLAGAVIGWS